MRKFLDSRLFDIVSSIVETVMAISLIILIVLVGFQRFSNRGNLFGYRIYTIASGSMIPTYNIGDTLLIKEMTSENIKVGDAVTYMGEAGGVDGMIITHQVQQVDIDENGKYSFHTKGIANNIEDPIVYEDQVLGKVVHKFFLLSIIGRVTTSMPLLFAFVAVPVAILIAIEIIKIVYKNDDDDDDEDDEEDIPLPIDDYDSEDDDTEDIVESNDEIEEEIEEKEEEKNEDEPESEEESLEEKEELEEEKNDEESSEEKQEEKEIKEEKEKPKEEKKKGKKK